MSSVISIDGQQWRENEVRRVKCTRWDDFMQEVRKSPAIQEEGGDNFGRGAIFRGHFSPEWKLSSRLERALSLDDHSTGKPVPIDGGLRQLNTTEWYESLCAGFLERFRLNAAGTPNVDIDREDNELWALGRHHGLMTPLLDWTTSPYVAAFFAFVDLYRKLEFSAGMPMRFSGGVVNVWGLRLWDNVEEEQTFEIIELRRERGSRLWAQSGLFTKLSSAGHLDIESYFQSRGIAHYLECYELRHESAMTALRDLDLMNINLATMYPDLQGAAEQANIQSELLRAAMTRIVGGSDQGGWYDTEGPSTGEP